MKTLKVLLQEVVSGIKAWVNSNFAQESNTVHKTGNETVNGNKYLTGYIRHNLTYDCIQATAFDVRTDPEADRGRDIFRFWEGDGSSLGDYLGGMSYYQETDGSSRLQLICFGYPTSGNAYQRRINFHSYRDGSSSFYPVNGSDYINLGTSANQWKSVYAKNYFYNGTAWGLDKYNIWTNSQAYKLTGTEVGSTTPGYISLSFVDKNNAWLGFQRASVYSDGRTCFSWKIYNTDNNSQSISSSLEYYITKAEAKVFAPVENGEVNLGTSNNKWKTINGVNPGALSFPKVDGWNSGTEINAAVGIDTTNWDMTGGTWNEMTNNVQDGWVYFAFQNCGSSDRALVRYYGTDARYLTMGFNAYGSTGGGYYLYIAFPMAKGSTVNIAFTTSGTVMSKFIYPCLGNV